MNSKQRPIFHIAFPVKSVEATLVFFRDQLGFRIDLIESGRCIIDFFGHQAVAHVSEKDVPSRVSLYPRHFGIILDDENEFDEFHRRVERVGVPFFERLFVRFAGTPREHKTFFLKDPSNNLIEFKWYRDASLIFKSDPGSPSLRKD